MTKEQIAAEIKIAEDHLAELRKKMQEPEKREGWWIIRKGSGPMFPIAYLGESYVLTGRLVASREATGNNNYILWGKF